MVSCNTTKPIKSGQVYINPKGVFSIPAPRSFIGTYADSEYEVTFYDDDGSLYKVEYSDLSEHVIQGMSEYPLAEQIGVNLWPVPSVFSVAPNN